MASFFGTGGISSLELSNEVSQPGGLKATEMYSLTVLEA